MISIFAIFIINFCHKTYEKIYPFYFTIFKELPCYSISASQCRLKLQTKTFQIHRIMIRHLAFKILTQQTQQFQCTSNSWLKGSETKKIKRKQRKKHNSHHVLVTEIKGPRTRENKLQKHLKKSTIPPIISNNNTIDLTFLVQMRNLINKEV